MSGNIFGNADGILKHNEDCLSLDSESWIHNIYC